MSFDRSHTDDMVAFIAESPSPYHAVTAAARRLETAGFTRIAEADRWADGGGGRYLIRGGALVAWWQPGGVEPHQPFRIVAAHTDSPNLRVKPLPDAGAAGWRQVAVEIYGGVPLNTWLDRDLGLSGRLVLHGGAERLVLIDRPIARVPQLAIHLDRAVNDGLTLDRQAHLSPLWGVGPREHGAFLDVVAAEAGVDAAAVAGFDLMFHDVTPPAYLGPDRGLVAAGRLDNLSSVHAGVAALVAAAARQPTGVVPVLAAFDHEEVGSVSTTGAGGPLLRAVLERLVGVRGGDAEDCHRAFAGSACLSCDLGHAVHPNYPERHEPGHTPMVNAGPLLKVNNNQRYATDAPGRALWTAACDQAGVPWQPYVARNSIPCGTTIGPITAGQLGVTTVDAGVAALSMHSARELCGADDPWMLAAAATEFLVGAAA